MMLGFKGILNDMILKKVLCLFLVYVAFIGSVDCQKIYELNWKQETVLLGVGVGSFISANIIDGQRDPITLEDLSKLDANDVNGFDNSAVDNFSLSAKDASDVFKNGIGVAPFALFLSSQGRENYKEILFMYTEVAAVNLGFTILVKEITGRYRPFAYNPEVDIEIKLDDTTRRSFFSGHVSHVSSMSFFTASVFSDLYPDSKYRYAVWAGAIAAPAITGYLRVEAGRHFASDVIIGYGVGALIGYFIPKLHKIKALENISINSTSDQIGLTYTF